MDEQHPALRLNADVAVIAEALRQALASVVGLENSSTVAERRTPEPSWTPLEPEPVLIEDTKVSSETT